MKQPVYVAHCQAHCNYTLNRRDGHHHQNLQCILIAHKFQFKDFCPVYKRSLWLSNFTTSHQLNLQMSIPTNITSVFLLQRSQAYFSSLRHSFLTVPLYLPLPSQIPYPLVAQEALPNHSSFYSFLLLSKMLTHIYYCVLLAIIKSF